MSSNKSNDLILEGICLGLEFVSSCLDLTAIQHVLEESVVKVDGCKLL